MCGCERVISVCMFAHVRERERRRRGTDRMRVGERVEVASKRDKEAERKEVTDVVIRKRLCPH